MPSIQLNTLQKHLDTQKEILERNGALPTIEDIKNLPKTGGKLKTTPSSGDSWSKYTDLKKIESKISLHISLNFNKGDGSENDTLEYKTLALSARKYTSTDAQIKRIVNDPNNPESEKETLLYQERITGKGLFNTDGTTKNIKITPPIKTASTDITPKKQQSDIPNEDTKKNEDNNDIIEDEEEEDIIEEEEENDDEAPVNIKIITSNDIEAIIKEMINEPRIIGETTVKGKILLPNESGYNAQQKELNRIVGVLKKNTYSRLGVNEDTPLNVENFGGSIEGTNDSDRLLAGVNRLVSDVITDNVDNKNIKQVYDRIFENSRMFAEDTRETRVPNFESFVPPQTPEPPQPPPPPPRFDESTPSTDTGQARDPLSMEEIPFVEPVQTLENNNNPTETINALISRQNNERINKSIEKLKEEITAYFIIYENTITEFKGLIVERGLVLKSVKIEFVRAFHKKIQDIVAKFFNNGNLKIGIILSADEYFERIRVSSGEIDAGFGSNTFAKKKGMGFRDTFDKARDVKGQALRGGVGQRKILPRFPKAKNIFVPKVSLKEPERRDDVYRSFTRVHNKPVLPSYIKFKTSV